MLAFVPVGERRLASVSGLSVGIMSATQGGYSSEQMLLDIGQGARIAASAYRSPAPLLSLRPSAATAAIDGWQAAVGRAEAAPQLLRPGLLASRIPGGAAYAGLSGDEHLDAIAASDRAGRVAAVSLGSAATLRARVSALGATRRLVVCDLPAGAAGLEDLRALSDSRRAGELLVVVERASEGSRHALLWAAAGGLHGGGRRELTSRTTRQRGLVAAVDIAPTILEHLGVAVPADMRGEQLETDGALDSSDLRAFSARLHVVGARRLSALGFLLSAWALLLLAAALPSRARGRSGRARALRIGGLAVLWAPPAAMIAAAAMPSAAVEYVTITAACLLLAALSDALLPWPRAPLVPAVAVILALVIDALAGTQLLVRSLLGPNPMLGARFYGFGNELKSGLAVLVLAALAGALYPAVRGRRAAIAVAGAGVLLAAIEGSARLGAGVGGVILVSAGFAVATILLLAGGLTRKRILLALGAPLAGLILLAALDLATAHGSGHFTGSILHARSAGDLRDVIVRRYSAAWHELRNHAMPVASALALLCAVVGVRMRRSLLAPVAGDPAWLAALAGGLTAGIVGALSEDSGPVLLVVAVFTCGCVASYLWGRPQPPSVTAEAQRTYATAAER